MRLFLLEQFMSMTSNEISVQLKNLPGWGYHPATQSLQKEFSFKSYLKTIAFVNALAWIANKENHHPDLEVSFSRCLVKLTTHDMKGVTSKDFSLAVMIDSL